MSSKKHGDSDTANEGNLENQQVWMHRLASERSVPHNPRRRLPPYPMAPAPEPASVPMPPAGVGMGRIGPAPWSPYPSPLPVPPGPEHSNHIHRRRDHGTSHQDGHPGVTLEQVILNGRERQPGEPDTPGCPVLVFIKHGTDFRTMDRHNPAPV